MKLRASVIPVLTAALTIALTVSLATSCKDKIGPQPFPMPKVPVMMTSGPDVQNYLVSHFWQPFFAEDRVYSRDTALIGGVTRDEFQAAYTNYATMLMTADVQRGLKAQEYLLAEAAKMKAADPDSKVWESVLSISDAMLYDPQSPIRNEEMYIPVEEAKVTSPYTSDEEKADAAALLPRLKLNRLGTPAADFGFTMRNGRKMRLYDVKADILIMLFSNPGCENCKEVIDQMSAMKGLDDLIASGKMAIVNVYPDADLEAWRDYAPIYPDNWYNGYNEALDVAGGLYNLRAIPSLYVLDEEKNVVFKDVAPVILFNYLNAALAR
ncbi:MAG: DUF5106 domain-containing protein [Bacteroidales bacterium]|nr:DUF5106 domain-containing protein [Bacteroidales bacterium]